MSTRRARTFTPYQTPLPPPDSYDPSLDAQQGAANRGLFDLGQDFNTQNTRDTVDYGLGHDAIQRGQTRGFEDLGTQRSQLEQSYGRSSSDLALARSRGATDHLQAVADLARRYQQQGTAQRQQQVHAGVMRGGAMLQAAAKRTANEALDQRPIDDNYSRFLQDNSTRMDRLTQDRLSQLGVLDTAGRRLTEDSDLQRGQLALQGAPPDASNPFGGRSFQDRTTQLTRAERENTQFGLDTTAARYYQAQGAGWTPPARGEADGMPSNEYVDPATGSHRQVRIEGNQAVAYDPSGNVLWRRRRAAA